MMIRHCKSTWPWPVLLHSQEEWHMPRPKILKWNQHLTGGYLQCSDAGIASSSMLLTTIIISDGNAYLPAPTTERCYVVTRDESGPELKVAFSRSYRLCMDLSQPEPFSMLTLL